MGKWLGYGLLLGWGLGWLNGLGVLFLVWMNAGVLGVRLGWLLGDVGAVFWGRGREILVWCEKLLNIT